ncbi:MAG: hypothetical protein LAT82_00320 [Nanoarchaeota archaeon]|nr:hypothetical protein [Nanoarchaeota archaeon]
MSKKSFNKLPPTGFMLASSILGIEGANYSRKLIEEGINKDYTFGNNVMRSVCSQSNQTPRNYGESEFLKTELSSVDAIRAFARRFEISIKSLSVEAQRSINLGYEPQDVRKFHMKELNFEDNEDPLILFSKRRKSSLESKIVKTFERITKYRKTEFGKRDENFEMLKSSFQCLEEDFGYNLLSWRSSRETPFEICDICSSDFSAVTYVINSTRLNSEGEIEEITNRNELRKRIDLVLSYAIFGGNRMIFNEKDNFQKDERDRALSFYTQNPRTFRAFETRIITPRDLIEATIGDRYHDGYKVIQQGKIEELRREDPFFAKLVNNTLDKYRYSSFSELCKK